MSDIHCIGFAVSPLLIILFACEMCSLEDVYNKGMISERQMSGRVAFYVFKVPLSLIVPLFSIFGVVLMVVVELASVLNIYREQKRLGKFRKMP